MDEATATVKGGEEPVKGEYLTVFLKVGDEWKILADASAGLKGMEDDDD